MKIGSPTARPAPGSPPSLRPWPSSLEQGNGFALIDPHGDLAERIAARIPPARQPDTIYFNPSDPAQPYGYNPLRQVRHDFISLAALGLMEVLKKMWADSVVCAWSTFCAMSCWLFWSIVSHCCDPHHIPSRAT